jgi:hypothetical protein
VALFLILMAGFAAGFIACLQTEHIARKDARTRYEQNGGDATPSTRAAVLAALKTFQADYSKRDPKDIDAFMRHVFDGNADILVLGTDEAEWERGYPAVSNFVLGDWQSWGDLRLDVDEPIINASEDVAWLTTSGEVQFGKTKRPIRFSAVLTRKNGNWLFRQVQFQWDDREPKPADLLRPETYLQLMRIAYRKILPQPAR